MTQPGSGGHMCKEALARLDAYIDNELLTESILELMEHFQRCKACTEEEIERRKVRTRLQTAVRQVRVPQALEWRVQDRLRQARQSQLRRFHLMAIAATLAVCFGSGVAYQLGTLRLTTAAQESCLATISSQAATIIPRETLRPELAAVVSAEADRGLDPDTRVVMGSRSKEGWANWNSENLCLRRCVGRPEKPWE